MLKDFKQFIAKGNVMDLAVAVIIGGAFALIVKSMTDDLIMPVVGAVFGNVDFSDKFVVLGGGEAEAGMTLEAAREAGLNVLAWGNFVSVAINFVILASSSSSCWCAMPRRSASSSRRRKRKLRRRPAVRARSIC